MWDGPLFGFFLEAAFVGGCLDHHPQGACRSVPYREPAINLDVEHADKWASGKTTARRPGTWRLGATCSSPISPEWLAGWSNSSKGARRGFAPRTSGERGPLHLTRLAGWSGAIAGRCGRTRDDGAAGRQDCADATGPSSLRPA